MKTLYIFLFLMLFSTSVFSQEAETPLSSLTAKRLRVINQTKCTQYFVVLGYRPCKCNDGEAFYSELKSIAPNSEDYYYDQNLGGLFDYYVGEKGIALVRIAGTTEETSCFFGGTIGQPCSSELSMIKYIANDTDCSLVQQKIYTR